MKLRNEADILSFVPWDVIEEQVLLDNLPRVEKAFENDPHRAEAIRGFLGYVSEMGIEAVANYPVYGSSIGIVVPIRKSLEPLSRAYPQHLVETLAHETLHWVLHSLEGSEADEKLDQLFPTRRFTGSGPA